jgi:RimJ/RimL family protein N-acetyltransferase
MRNKALLDIPKHIEQDSYAAEILNTNKKLPVWHIISRGGEYLGIIGVAAVKNGINYIQVAFEEKHRGNGLFVEAFSLMELTLSYEYYIPTWGLTTLTTNQRMQRAALSAGFNFVGIINSPNKTGNKLFRYEMPNELRFLYKKSII